MVEREKIGFVVPPGDRDGLRDGILFLYRHGEARKRMGDLARAVLMENIPLQPVLRNTGESLGLPDRIRLQHLLD